MSDLDEDFFEDIEEPRGEDFFDSDILTNDIYFPEEAEPGHQKRIRSTTQVSFPRNKIKIPEFLSQQQEEQGVSQKVAPPNVDYVAEAMRFMEDPFEENNVFYLNYDHLEIQLLESGALPDGHDFITNLYEREMELKQTQNALVEADITPIADLLQVSHAIADEDIKLEMESSKSSSVGSRCASPDIFAEEEAAIETLDEPSQEAKVSPQSLLVLQNHAACMITSSTNRKAQLIQQIESIVLLLLEQAISHQPITIYLPNTQNWSNCFYDEEDCTIKLSADTTHRKLTMESGVTSFRLTLILYLLAEVYHLLVTGTTCTVRELFYRNPEFAQDQIKINAAVKDLMFLLNCAPWEAGILSSSKGFIAGPLFLTFSDGEILDLGQFSGPTIMPHNTSEIVRLETTAELVLIVEKDTVFESLIKQDIMTCLGKNVILMTGRGYPDINTRMMTRKIASTCKIPVYVLVDADPYGIEILLVYRHGSRALSPLSDHLACPEVRWIGVYPSEIEALAIPWMPLTEADNHKLRSLLERDHLTDEIKNELLILQRTNKKSEIEALSSFSINFLVDEYIPHKLNRNLSL